MKLVPCFLSLAAAGLLTIPARAQMDPNGMMFGYTQNLLAGQARDRALGTDSFKGTHKAPSRQTPNTRRLVTQPRAPSTAAFVAANTRYRASPPVAARVKAEFIASVRSKSGDATARAIQGEMDKRDLLQYWASQTAADGLHLGDLADVMAQYWLTQWQFANGEETVPTSHVQGVRRMMAKALLSSAAFGRTTDAQRQEIAETLIYNQFVQGEAYLGAVKRHDQAALRQLTDAAVDRFQAEMRIDPRRLAVTESGFVPRP
jgi:hypothetical protein